MTTTSEIGRFGNQLIRNISVSLIAEKHNLKVNYSSKYLSDKLGVLLFSGSNSYEITKQLNDNNFFTIYGYDNINYNLNPNDNYFQTKEITDLIYNYLRSNKIKSNIISNNIFKERYNNNNDVCLHIRLTDAARWNPGVTYYINSIKNITFDNVYLSTDDINHEIIQQILNIYPFIKIIDYDVINTLQFVSTCKNVILSHGSFSALIGYLSFFSNIYYPEYEHDKMWYGDMFTKDNFIKLSIK